MVGGCFSFLLLGIANSIVAVKYGVIVRLGYLGWISRVAGIANSIVAVKNGLIVGLGCLGWCTRVAGIANSIIAVKYGVITQLGYLGWGSRVKGVTAGGFRTHLVQQDPGKFCPGGWWGAL